MSVSGRPVIFGEVLFDRFPDQSSVLGGAPFNVAWHLQGFGLDPLFISRVGDDGLGRQVGKAMHEWGMSTSGLQIDADHPTGVVHVSIEDSQPSFDIVPDQAYDHIAASTATHAVDAAQGALLYHGSLIMRGDHSRSALTELRRHTRLPCFVDINLRPPWYNAAQIDDAFKTSRWLKINDNELGELCHKPGLSVDVRRLEQEAGKLQQQLGLEALIVTRGADGAFLIDCTGDMARVPPANVIHLVDTVGAGDAFSAIMLFGLLSGWPLDVSLYRAAGFAASVCAMRGATGFDRSLYSNHLAEWKSTDE